MHRNLFSLLCLGRGFLRGLVLSLGMAPVFALATPARSLAAVAEPRFDLVVDQAYEEALKEVLQDARTRVDIVHFEFFSEKGFVKSVAELLIEMKLKKPELVVRVMLEGDHEGVAERNKKTLEKLTAVGIEVVLDAPEQMTHAKLVLVDDRVALFGSHNLTNNSIENNNETSVLIVSETLGSKLRAYVDRLFEDPSRNRTGSFSDGPLTVLTDAAYFEQARRLVQASTKSVELAMYFLAYRSDADVAVKALLDDLVAAAKRGVAVRLFLEQSDRFAPAVTEANRKATAYLKERGVGDIYFDRLDKFSHAKYLIVDGQHSLLGSTNWYAADLEANHQVNVLVDDAPFASALTQLFETKLKTEGQSFIGGR